jgi:hypothetical protein
MSRSRAVILTYPPHFLLTRLAIWRFRRVHPEVKRLTLIVDDFSSLAWEHYPDHCREFYTDMVDEIIFTSEHRRFGRLRKWPWLRQQCVKLNLDYLFPNESSVFWFDGDLLLYQPVPKDITPFTIAPYHGVPLSERDPGPGEVTSQQSYYVQHMLGIPHTGIHCQGQRVCVSHPPFRDIDLEDLRQLKSYVESRLGRDIIGAHLDICVDTRHSASEWELLAWYQQEILKKELTLMHWPTHDVVDTVTDSVWAATCWRGDREIDMSWWEQQPIDWQRYWAILPKDKYSPV